MTDFARVPRYERHRRLAGHAQFAQPPGLGALVALRFVPLAALILAVVGLFRSWRRTRDLDALAEIGRSFAGLPFAVTGWRDYLLADRPTVGVLLTAPPSTRDLADAAHAIDRRIAVATIDDNTVRFHLPASAVADLGVGSIARRLIDGVIRPLSGVTRVVLGGEVA